MSAKGPKSLLADNNLDCRAFYTGRNHVQAMFSTEERHDGVEVSLNSGLIRDCRCSHRRSMLISTNGKSNISPVMNARNLSTIIRGRPVILLSDIVIIIFTPIVKIIIAVRLLISVVRSFIIEDIVVIISRMFVTDDESSGNAKIE